MSNRFVLLDELQKCIWTSPTEIPEIDIQFADVIKTFANYDAAISHAKALLGSIGADMTYADVRPIEQCARCADDFNTNSSHHTMVVSEEVGEETNPEVVNVWYVARFCQGCNDAIKGRL